MAEVKILGISGKKQSGKSTLHLGLRLRSCLHRTDGGFRMRVREMSLAEPLKQFCIEVLGLRREQCYGTDEEKNSLTRIRWEDLPFVVLWDGKVPDFFDDPFDGTHEVQMGFITDGVKRGYMTGREVMEIFGTEILRRINPDVWVEKFLRDVEKLTAEERNGFEDVLVVVTDVRFPNEVEGILGAGGEVVRLTRDPFPDSTHPAETSLDRDVFDWGRFSYVLDNAGLGKQEQLDELVNWLRGRGVIAS